MDSQTFKKEEYLTKCILAPLVYFDLFDFPLTLVEIWKHLLEVKALPFNQSKVNCSDLSLKNISINDILNVLEENPIMKKIITFRHGFYFLKGREHLISLRQKRLKIAQTKWKRAWKICKFLQIIPFIKMIAVCNTLAYNNVKDESDIDLFIVTKFGRIWTARFLITLLTQILGMRRYGNLIKDRICLSYYVTDSSLNLKETSALPCDIHLIYWISDFVLIFEREKIRQCFFEKNSWIKKYLPNFLEHQTITKKREIPESKISSLLQKISEKILSGKLGNLLEAVLKKIQKYKMSKNLPLLSPKYNIIISDQMLKFHPKDIREEIVRQFEKNLDILLNRNKLYGKTRIYQKI